MKKSIEERELKIAQLEAEIKEKVEHFAKEIKALEKAKEYEQKRNEEQLDSHKREIGRKEEIMLKAAEEFKIEISKKEKTYHSLQKEKIDLEDISKK